MKTILRKAVVFVPYRPAWYYQQLGPCVRDWAMIETASRICAEVDVPVHIVDRPKFPPWWNKSGGSSQLRPISEYLPKVQIDYPPNVKLLSTLLQSRRASGPIVSTAIAEIAEKYDRILVIDFDPFARITTPSNVLYWFDEIDDFSLHRRISLRDRHAFAAKRAKTFDIHTASSAAAASSSVAPAIAIARRLAA